MPSYSSSKQVASALQLNCSNCN